ncbi:MAG: hypothetical protein IH604_01225 [Burkholderiales bacterium]|nr:hypothetical protein [Burkholderiales bacterium]
MRRRFGNSADAEDLLQEVFIKATRQGERFCAIASARASGSAHSSRKPARCARKSPNM